MIINQLKSIYNSPIKDSHSHHIHTHPAMISSNDEMTQYKCFAADTPSFCDLIWSCVELFSEIEHKMALASIIITMETRPPEKLVIIK